MNKHVRRVELSNGVTLSYAEQGDPSGVPVVLLHGLSDSWRSFEPVMAHLPPSVHAFALTQRGHGDSAKPEAGYRPADFADDVAAFVDALDLGPAVIAGHSMGSYVAQRVAIDHPERVLGLVLLGSFATRLRNNPVAVELWDAVVATLTDPVGVAFVREFQESTLARTIPPDFLNTVVLESLKVPARVWKASFEELLDADHSAELGKIAARTLVAWGDRDLFCPRTDQEILATGIVDSRLEVYSGAGHGLHWEEPARFAAGLAGFAQDLIAPMRVCASPRIRSTPRGASR